MNHQQLSSDAQKIHERINEIRGCAKSIDRLAEIANELEAIETKWKRHVEKAALRPMSFALPRTHEADVQRTYDLWEEAKKIM